MPGRATARATPPAPARATSRPAAPRARASTSAARTFLLDVPFDMRGVARAGGATWDADQRATLYVGEALPVELRPFASQPFSWERWQEDDLNATTTAASGTGEIVPRPHQVAAADAIVAAARRGRPGFLLADDVGLGKTISAWAAIQAMPGAHNVLVVCPLAVVPHWRRTIAMMGTAGKRVCIVNYDRLKHLLEPPRSARTAKRVRTRNRAIATRGTALARFDVVVADESHKLRNPVSQRSAAFRRVVQAGLDGHGAFVIWLSATCGQNPLELGYLAPLLADATGQRVADLKDFEVWCADQGIGVTRGAYGAWQWLPNEADLERVRRLLFEGTPPVGLRRRPEEIADWPEQHRALWPIALDATERRLYDEAWTVFRREMELAARGRDPRGALVAQTRFRQKASLLRVPGTVALVEDLLENGVQVAISVVWRETLAAIQAGLATRRIDCAVLHGEQSIAERESERTRFQRGAAGAICFTLEEGFSLHAGERAVDGTSAPRVTIAADPKWSAIAALQVEGRCHRDGQPAPCYYLYAEETVEEKIVRIVLGRMSTMKQMIGDDPATLRAIEAALAE